MKWIGLSGGMGCGKSTALQVFKELNCGVSSADQIVSDLYNSKNHLIEILKSLDLNLTSSDKKDVSAIKAQISKVVFSDKAKLKKLENYLHPIVRKSSEAIKSEHQKQGFKVSVYEVPLLFEKHLENLFFRTICIGATKNIQIERIKNRNPDWSLSEINLRLSTQMSLSDKKEKADFYIDNSKDLKNLKSKCEHVLKEVLDL